jgi:hypothetical protein
MGKVDHTIVSTTFHYILIFFEYQYTVLVTRVRGCRFYETGEEIS